MQENTQKTINAFCIEKGGLWKHKHTGLIYEVDYINTDYIFLADESGHVIRPILIEELIANYDNVCIDEAMCSGGIF